MRTRLCSWLSILIVLAAANHAAAADGDTYARVCVTNAQGIRVILDPPGAPQPVELAARDANYEARISGREALQIEFCDKNPVLFTYSVGELKTTPLADVAAMDALAAAIGEFAKVAAATQGVRLTKGVVPAVAGDARKNEEPCDRLAVASLNGINPADLQKEIQDLREQYERIPAIIQVTHDPNNSLLSDETRNLSAKLTKAPKVRALLKSLDNYAAARMTGGPIPYELERRDGSTVSGVIQGTELSVEDSCLRGALRPILGNLDFIANRSDKLAAMLDALEALSTALQGVGETTTAATLHYDSKSRREQPLTIGANATFAKFFSPATKQFAADPKKVGTISINVEPQLDLRIQVAPGVIYSFVKQPKFAAEKNDAGAFTIQQTESNYAAADAIVAVNITRDKYVRENVRPFVQIGVRPKKDELAFVLGGGIALDDANKAVLSFGAIYQERKKLAPGLSVGGTLTSADDLKTDTEFKVGFYVGVSYNLINAK